MNAVHNTTARAEIFEARILALVTLRQAHELRL
jgi:hypothetical protein